MVMSLMALLLWPYLGTLRSIAVAQVPGAIFLTLWEIKATRREGVALNVRGATGFGMVASIITSAVGFGAGILLVLSVWDPHF
jgi:hypothetical protein